MVKTNWVKELSKVKGLQRIRGVSSKWLKEIDNIASMIESGSTQKEIAHHYDISPTTLQGVLRKIRLHNNGYKPVKYPRYYWSDRMAKAYVSQGIEIRSAIYNGIEYHDYTVDSLGRIWDVYTGHTVGAVSMAGYVKVKLGRKTVFTHRVVAETFKGPPIGDKDRVNHINSNKLDNSPDNLEWVTCKYNLKHAAANGKSPLGKLSPDQVRSARAEYQYGVSGKGIRSIAKKYKVDPSSMRDLLVGKTYTLIT